MTYRNWTEILMSIFLAFPLLFFIFLSSSSNVLSAQSQIPSFQVYGPGIVFEDEPNVFYLIGDIRDGDYFEIRRYIRQTEVEYLVLSSPGGSVWEALQISGMIHDLEIPTIIPSGSICASACSLIYFAGQPRVAVGSLGVHQFSTAGHVVSEADAQFTTSEIISFLNEYSTPSFVFEHMFRSGEMYFFNQEELAVLSTASPSSIGIDLPFTENRITSFLNALAAQVSEQTPESSSSPADINTPNEVNVVFGPPPVVPTPRPIELTPAYISPRYSSKSAGKVARA